MSDINGPTINRSKVQLATSYAPGNLFTFEGGKGCFLSVPVMTQRYNTNINIIVERQIKEQLFEFITNWFNKGVNCRAGANPPTYAQQVLDSAFMDYRKVPTVSMDNFTLLEPLQMGYHPDPLAFCCRKCGLLHNYTDVDDFIKTHPGQEKRDDCKSVGGGRHDWLQLDVVFAHWSGNYAPLYPEYPCSCGNNEFYLRRSTTGVFSDWDFKCTSCPSKREITRRDKETKDLLEEKLQQGIPHQVKEWLMLPISYRGSSLYYVQTDRFIPYPDASIFELLQPNRYMELATRLLVIYRYPEQPVTDDEIRETLRQNGQEASYRMYEAVSKLVTDFRHKGDDAAAKQLEEQLKKMLADWEQQGWINRTVNIPPDLIAKTAERSNCARRYDPIRLGIEHALLEDRHLAAITGVQQTTVNLLNPSPDLAPKEAEDEQGKQVYKMKLQVVLDRLDIHRFLFIRGLDLVQYSFGYSRVSPTPTTVQKNMTMPVRLRAFAHVERGKHPIYVLHQKNEAFYIQLGEDKVKEWLAANGLGAALNFKDGAKFGARYIEQYNDFGSYLDDYKRRDQIVDPSICNMTYLLLHTLAHQYIHSIAEYSGLDLGSFGEYIFPADLAFLVYRSGMTPDLGNLSSMWRNFHVKCLEQMFSANKLLCSSGSLCDHRGGACPGCIMIPETTCIAGNLLLSRAALKGGPAPLWSSNQQDIVGFFNVANQVSSVCPNAT
jgi:hypothetical protein